MTFWNEIRISEKNHFNCKMTATISIKTEWKLEIIFTEKKTFFIEFGKDFEQKKSSKISENSLKIIKKYKIIKKNKIHKFLLTE